MRYATTLYQLPIGLVVTALSIAILPTLSEQALGSLATFKRTLAEGVRMVLALILPATTGLFALAAPIVALLFEHGEFTAYDTDITTWVLRLFLFGVPFAALDQMLIFASYARKDTLRPAVAGIISIVVYVAVAALLLGPLGLFSLMIADAVKHVVHTVLMLRVLETQIDGLAGHGVVAAGAKSLVAALGTGLSAYIVATLVGQVVSGPGFIPLLITVASAAGVGLLLFLGMARALGLEEARSLRRLIGKRRR
jgi:putative peptidoglycan lipid II flippase